MHLLCLLSSGNLSGTDSPDWLVGNDNLAPVLWLDNLGDSTELAGNDIDGGVLLALLERLSAAKDDVDVLCDGLLGLGCDELVGLADDGAALGVTDKGPGDVAVLKLCWGDLASVGTLVLVEDVLGSNGDVWLGLGAGKGEEKGWWCNDDL